MNNSLNNSEKINDLIPVKRVLLSLSNKNKLKNICEFFKRMRCELVATKSTYEAIKELGFDCETVESITKFPEILGGRVKTLHPKIFGGILARNYVNSDSTEIQEHNIKLFDIVVCNLYPYQIALEKNILPTDLIDNIDIGGVSLLRASAKNYLSVSILCDVDDYDNFINIVIENNGNTTLSLRKQLAIKAFRETAAYDEIISSSLEKRLGEDEPCIQKSGPIRSKYFNSIDSIPDFINLSLVKKISLRYGENPHQKAAFYSLSDLNNKIVTSVENLKCFHGKELSYNNVLDIEHSIKLIYENIFKKKYGVIIMKHNTPCGVGISKKSIYEAYSHAFDSDPISPFGGIVCTNSKITVELAHKIQDTFLEIIIAPEFDKESEEILQRKKNIRLVTYDANLPLSNNIIFTHVQGGFLVQSKDEIVFESENVICPTILKPNDELLNAFLLGMTVVKHVRSNAIVLANANQTISIAGGFTNRIDAVEHCLRKARLSLSNAILASDAFFPFPDSIEIIKNSGIKFIVQPGGSIRDAEVVKACDKFGISMILTGIRHFKH